MFDGDLNGLRFRCTNELLSSVSNGVGVGI
jgi:hypothetical protein